MDKRVTAITAAVCLCATGCKSPLQRTMDNVLRPLARAIALK